MVLMSCTCHRVIRLQQLYAEFWYLNTICQQNPGPPITQPQMHSCQILFRLQDPWDRILCLVHLSVSCTMRDTLTALMRLKSFFEVNLYIPTVVTPKLDFCSMLYLGLNTGTSLGSVRHYSFLRMSSFQQTIPCSMTCSSYLFTFEHSLRGWFQLGSPILWDPAL